jgi:hypothetical protein
MKWYSQEQINQKDAKIDRLKSLLVEALMHVSEHSSWFTATTEGERWIEKVRKEAYGDRDALER